MEESEEERRKKIGKNDNITNGERNSNMEGSKDMNVIKKMKEELTFTNLSNGSRVRPKII